MTLKFKEAAKMQCKVFEMQSFFKMCENLKAVQILA